MFKALACTGLFMAASACAQSPNLPRPHVYVFGIAIGASLSIPECNAKTIAGSVFYELPDSGPCFQRLQFRNEGPVGSPLTPNAVLAITYPPGREPEMALTGVTVGLRNGTVQSIVFSTVGVASQDRDLGALQMKFGPPTWLARPAIRNAFEPSARGTLAAWQLPSGINVIFNSANGRPDSGLVQIEMKDTLANHDTALAKVAAGRPQL